MSYYSRDSQGTPRKGRNVDALLDKIQDAKIENGTISIGGNSITPITEHQDISGKANVGDSYTKQESDVKYSTKRELNTKQNIIPDLNEIRNNAQSDPVFSASPAANITSADIVSWNNKLDTAPVTSVNGQTGAVSLSIPNDADLVHKTDYEDIVGKKHFMDGIVLDNSWGGPVFISTIEVGYDSTNKLSLSSSLPYGYSNDKTEDFSWIVWKGRGEVFPPNPAQHWERSKTLQEALDERTNVQADWNQTSPIEPDYIKNKPEFLIDYSKQYLTFGALQNGTFKFTNPINYSIDNGTTWVSLAANTSTPTITAGNKIMWKAELTPSSSNPRGIGTFSSTGNFNVEGNPMSLLYDDEFKNQTDLTGKNYAFYQLFKNCSKLISAENLSLPATTLAPYCYCGMFLNCTSLTTAPELPATTIASYCYLEMFTNCTALTTAPELPATTLVESCYYSMFQGCTSLITAPSILPATTLATYCYYYMFAGCTALTNAPELPATTLEVDCYAYMFYGCTSLIAAPELPATTLAGDCYDGMFKGCTALVTAPELPATTLANGCYSNMFNGCTSLTTAPELPATILANYCYEYMFNGCTNLNYIKAMFITTPNTTYTNNWVNRVASTGTFIKNSAAEWNVIGNNGVPTGWTVYTENEYEVVRHYELPDVQIQSDWNQTNTTQVDYIKNKPTNVSDFTNDAGYTNNIGTITGITMNGVSQGTSGVIDLGTVVTSHQDISGKANKSETISSLSLSLDPTTYELSLSGYMANGRQFIVADVIDLPLESVVVSGSYDDTTKKVVLTLQNGSTIDFSVADLVAGLQSEITSASKLSADLIEDGNTNKTVTGTDKANWNGKYTKPSTGIPATDLSTDVQSSLNKANTALQSYTETDPVFSSSAAASITTSDITAWNNKSDFSGSYNDLTDTPTIPAAQIQSDWNQTTTTAKDYIKNKPNIHSNMGLYIEDDHYVVISTTKQSIFFDDGTAEAILINGDEKIELSADNIYLSPSVKAYYNNKEIAVKDDIKVTSVDGKTGAVIIDHPVTTSLNAKVRYISAADPGANGAAFGTPSQCILLDADSNVDIITSNNGKLRVNYNEVALKDDIPTVPTNVSAFTNDAGYLTAHQDITGKADKVSATASGNIASFDSNGNLADSNITVADISDAVSKKHAHSNKTMLDLVPASLGTTGQALMVNAAGTGLEFGTVASSATQVIFRQW